VYSRREAWSNQQLAVQMAVEVLCKAGAVSPCAVSHRPSYIQHAVVWGRPAAERWVVPDGSCGPNLSRCFHRGGERVRRTGELWRRVGPLRWRRWVCSGGAV
jgi:hypothetical protein